jgi:LCP family protein required for cell wall assembly
MKILKTITVFVVIAAILVIGFYVFITAKNFGGINNDGTVNNGGNTVSNNVPLDFTKTINILILGSDQRTWDESGRSDVIILVNINPKTKKINLISIPRDSRVEIPGHGFNKVNAAYNSLFYNDGGIKLSIKTIENLLGLPDGSISYFVVFNFDGFKKVIDALGGVTIDVTEPMHYHSKLGDVNIDLEPGVQHLDGEKALEYARFRYDQYGDFTRTPDGKIHGRVARQEKLIEALINQTKSLRTIWRLPQISNAISKAIYTNITPSQFTKLALLLKNDTAKDLNIVPFPGTDRYIDGISYVVPDYDKLKEMGKEYFMPEPVN